MDNDPLDRNLCKNSGRSVPVEPNMADLSENEGNTPIHAAQTVKKIKTRKNRQSKEDQNIPSVKKWLANNIQEQSDHSEITYVMVIAKP